MEKNTLSKSRAIKQASLRNPTPSLIERRVEPLKILNKCYTVHNLRGLPPNAPYACTGVHEFGNLLFFTILSQSIDTPLCPQSLTLPAAGPS